VGLSFCGSGRPDFPLTFCQNFVEKFPCPSPSPGAHHVWKLSRPPPALPSKKNLGAPGPPTGEIWGVKFSTFPPSPSISLRQISEIFRPLAGLDPGYNPRDFGKSAGNAAGDIFTFELAPGPMVCIASQTYKTESFILLDTPPHSAWSESTRATP